MAANQPTPQIKLNEYTLSEKPLIDQLVAMGWTYVVGDLDDPAVTGRTSFAEVLQSGVLRAQLKRINTRPQADGSRVKWLDEERISSAVSPHPG